MTQVWLSLKKIFIVKRDLKAIKWLADQPALTIFPDIVAIKPVLRSFGNIAQSSVKFSDAIFLNFRNWSANSKVKSAATSNKQL